MGNLRDEETGNIVGYAEYSVVKGEDLDVRLMTVDGKIRVVEIKIALTLFVAGIFAGVGLAILARL